MLKRHMPNKEKSWGMIRHDVQEMRYAELNTGRRRFRDFADSLGPINQGDCGQKSVRYCKPSQSRHELRSSSLKAF